MFLPKIAEKEMGERWITVIVMTMFLNDDNTSSQLPAFSCQLEFGKLPSTSHKETTTKQPP